jgi:hypothetical protein
MFHSIVNSSKNVNPGDNIAVDDIDSFFLQTHLHGEGQIIMQLYNRYTFV